jgi:vancomycin resistance protein YoaR
MNIRSLPRRTWSIFRRHQQLMLILLVMAVLVVAGANVILSWYFNDHFYPGTNLGGLDASYLTPLQASEQLQALTSAPVRLDFAGQAVSIPVNDLGVDYHIEATVQQVSRLAHPVIPMLAWLPADRQLPLLLDQDRAQLQQQAAVYAQTYSTQPVNASLKLQGNQATIAEATPGHLFTASQVADQIGHRLQHPSRQTTTITGQVIQPAITSQHLSQPLQQLQQKMDLHISLAYADNLYRPSADQIGAWFTAASDPNVADSQPQLQLDQQAIKDYIADIASDIDRPVSNTIITTKDGIETGRQPGQDGLSVDQAAAVAALTQALTELTDLEYTLVTNPVAAQTEYVRTYSPRLPTYTYCVGVRDVDAAYLSQFASSIAQTLSDGRGWSLAGKIKFQQVQSGCGMKLWLAAASALPTFSSGCSALYSCRVGSNVIINQDPWLHATPTWNSHGGSLADYRALVVNHEVGHWLGFDHWHCGGAGQPAPVMQQQSIDLEGCNINAWPLPAELSALRQMKGV